MNTLFLDALQGKNTYGKPPVWLMRQAGRYLPEYRALRSKFSFLQMCHTPELIAEITEMPLRRYSFDAAILFSDILVIPEALGVGLRFEDNKGPMIERPVETKNDVLSLPSPPIFEVLNYVSKGITSIKQRIKVPLIGFCGAPFTVASYMIEGGVSKDLKKTKQWMIKDPESFHLLLEKITACTMDYIQLQILAGIDAFQIFDSWAWVLDDSHFRSFSLHYMDKLVKSCKVPTILFCRGSSVFAQIMAECSPAGLSIDWNGNLSYLRKTLPPNLALQGNLDPDILYASAPVVRQHVKRLLQSMQNDQAYIFNLGHGIHPDTPLASVEALISEIKN